MRRPGGLLAWGLIAFLYLPVITLVVFAFQESPRLGLPFDGPSLRWFEAIWNDAGFRRALWASVRIATASCSVALVVATLAALGLRRYRLRYGSALSVAAVVPIALPGLLVGLALLTYFSSVGMRPSLTTVVIAHTIYVTPYVLMVVTSGLEQLDPSIEEAARDLGASPWQAFWRSTFPLLWPAILGAAVLAFALSFDEFLITLFVIGGDSTLPVFIWSRMRRTIDPSVNAVATGLLTIVITGAVTALSLALMARRRTGVSYADDADSTATAVPLAPAQPGEPVRVAAGVLGSENG